MRFEKTDNLWSSKSIYNITKDFPIQYSYKILFATVGGGETNNGNSTAAILHSPYNCNLSSASTQGWGCTVISTGSTNFYMYSMKVGGIFFAAGF